MKVLVTGGHGFVGRHLQKVRPDWIYINSQDVDLTVTNNVYNYLSMVQPDAIIHLAAVVGGIKANDTYPESFFYQNSMMNLNVLSCATVLKIPRVLSSLSTCAWPDYVDKYPFDEYDLHKGAPAETNISYGFSKRALHVHSNACRKQYGFDYSTFAPSNLYGPGDNFDLDTSHFIAAMIRKIDAVDGGRVEFWGSGKPLRQQLYVEDLAKIIPMLLEKYNDDLPLIVAPNENLSIKEMIDIFLDIVNKDVEVVFNNKLDGQYRKDGDNSELLHTIGDFEFTSFKDGVKKTYEWYKEMLNEQKTGIDYRY